MKCGRKKVALVGAVLLGLAVFCSCSSGAGLTEFAVKAGLIEQKEAERIVIPVVVPLEYAQENNDFLKGVQLAQKEMERLDSPIPIEVRVDDDKGDFSEAVRLAQEYVGDPEVVGVVGHWYSDVCSSVVQQYERGQKVLLVPTVSLIELTDQNSTYVFQNIPSDGQIGQAMVGYARECGLKRGVIYYEDSTYGFTMSADLEKNARNSGIEIVDKLSGLVNRNSLSDIKLKWDALQYDVVFVVDNVDEGSAFINALRELDPHTLVICSDGMDSASLPELLKDGEGPVVVASIHNQDRANQEMQLLRNRFVKEFDAEPDMWAYQGYDCVMMIARAVAEGGVTTSGQLREYLESSDGLQSVFGSLTFDGEHKIQGKAVYLKSVGNSGVRYLK